jgi:hypothetical protein
MINPAELVDSLVALLRDIPELVTEMNGDEQRIFAYHDQYPRRASLAAAIHEMPAPGIMAAWQGTQPSSFGGVDVWRHQVTLYLRARETFDGDPPCGYYRLFRLISKGVPSAEGVPDLPPSSLPAVIWEPGFHSTCPAILPVDSENCRANSSGVRCPRLLCGLSVLYSFLHASISSFASARFANQFAFRHSSLSRPLKLSR